MASIYLACSLAAAALLATFLDPLPQDPQESLSGSDQMSGFKLLSATIRQLGSAKQLLIVPITFWSGLEQGFFGADFTAGFITCAFGIHTVGRVLILYGAANALASIAAGFVRRWDACPSSSLQPSSTWP